MTTWAEIDDLAQQRWAGQPGGRRGSERWWKVPSPTGGYLRLEVTLRRRWCSLAVDRWPTTDRTEEPSTTWFQENVWPAVQSATAERRTGYGLLPSGGGAFACATPIERSALVDILTAWIDQELTWGVPRDEMRYARLSTSDDVSRETVTPQGEQS